MKTVIPIDFRNQDNIEAGQFFDIERLGRGEYRLVMTDPPKNQGLVETLLACPSKGWFVPVESESADSLEVPS
ncbi:MAG: hypothetical protein F4Z15_03055 [Gammaproteobacteria bacterium]|nr:hypothetical protein [Gammaproteobacteria bacterium]MYD76976.1 hypothetical protein [Gammaproteobacteria bacterium]MYJ51130.1 hypothetical protein [Gammaproteobacteria bacterium]